MISRWGLLALVCCVFNFSGCVGAHRVNTVPWWKGLPAMVIAPSSIEAHVWREHLHGRDGQHECTCAGECACDFVIEPPLDEFDPTWEPESPPAVIESVPLDPDDNEEGPST
jgi:hypothetical protein